MAAVLPATRTETRAIRGVLSEARERVNRRASESAAREALARGDLVHVASHGSLNVQNPLFSRIELARVREDAPPEDDGRLEVHELLDMEIRSPLVFLSGCETGLGASGSTLFVEGEDYATLAQAFLYAGAQNVIATLWRIEDEGAARFAEAFYRRLAELGTTAGLAAAQRELIKSAEFARPFYWAPYRLTGSGAP